MADLGSIIPDTATVPVARDLVHPQQQNGSVSGADQKHTSSFRNGQPEQLTKPKAGVVKTILAAPAKGPRSGIHWGAGVQLSPFLLKSQNT